MSNVTFRTFSSDEKTDITHQRSLTNKMIFDIKRLKNLNLLNNSNKKNLNKFHHNSLKHSFKTNYRYFQSGKDKLKSSDSTIIPQLRIFPPLDLYNSFNKTPFTNRTLSINSLSSIQNYTSRNQNNYFNHTHYFNFQNKTEIKHKRTRNKIKFIQRFNYTQVPMSKIRAETVEEFTKKTKRILFENYIKTIQENEIKNIKEERSIEIDLMNLQILNYQKMIHLIQLYIESTDNYLMYLNKKIEIEKEIQIDLFERRNEVLHETYLLRHRFGRLQRKFEYCLNNKFFLLCVKNKTGLFEKFSEEDQIDYQIDIRSLDVLSNFNNIQRQFNKKKNYIC